MNIRPDFKMTKNKKKISVFFAVTSFEVFYSQYGAKKNLTKYFT